MNNQMKQLSELHRMYGLAMKDIIVRLWPAEPISSSYFGFMRQLVDALPRVEAVKRSACIEGARMTFAHVKTHWPKMKAADVAITGPPEGQDHRKLERYFENVLAGAQIVASQCSKNVMFE